MRDASWIESLRAEVAASGPEAASVMSHPAVEAAIEGGGGAALERALRQARPLAATHGERELIDRLLTQRRLFMAPVKSAPTMFRLNGVGTALHGAADRARDGTYIATLFFTFVFVPVVPLSSWLVREAGGRSWTFLGKVPLSPAHRVWRWVVAGLHAAFILFGVMKGRSPGPPPPDPTLHIVNELDVPLTILVGDAARALGAHAVTKVTLPPGRHTGVAKGPTAEVVETIDLDLAADDRFYAWNVLGAAPVRIATVEFLSESLASAGGDTKAPVLEDFAGVPFVAAARVDYPFQELPNSVKSIGRRSERRVSLVVEGGLSAACTMLRNAQGAERAADLAERVAWTVRDDAAIETAVEAAAAAGPARTRAFIESALVRVPGSVAARRAHQEMLWAEGRDEQVLKTYRVAHEVQPTDPDAAYLYGRILDGKASLAVLAPALELHPRHAWLLRGVVWAQIETRAFSSALATIDRLVQAKPRDVRGLLALRVRAMLGLGRLDEARQLVLSRVKPGAVEELLVYARLRRLPPDDASLPSTADVLGKVFGDEAGPELAMQTAAAGRDEPWFERAAAAPGIDATLRDALRVVVLAARDVAAAADLAAMLPEDRLAKDLGDVWDEATRVAIACELLRTGREARARACLRAHPNEPPIAFDRLTASLEGRESGGLGRWDPEARAALRFAMARRTTDPEARSRLIEAARIDDPFRAVVPADAK